MAAKKSASKVARADRLKTPAVEPRGKSPAASSPPPEELRTRAENSLTRTRRSLARMPAQDVQRLVHELQVHQIELEMQNDELRRTQLGLEEAGDRYSDLFDFAPCALLTLGQRREVLEANLAASLLLGLKRKELLQRKFTRFIPAEAQGAFSAFCQQLLNSETRQACELTLRRATGSRLTARLEGIAGKDSKTHQTLCRFSLIDVTASKRAEAALMTLNARLDGIISSAMDAMISVDARQHIVLFNHAAEQMFGMTAQQALGQNLGRLIPEPYRAGHGGHVSQYGETGVSSRSMGRLGVLLGLRANGEEFPVEASISQVDIHGERLFTVILRDITERKKAEAALQDMALFPQQDTSPVLRVTREGALLYANPAADSLLRQWQCGLGGTVPAFVHRAVSAVLKSGVSQELELNHAGRDLCFVVTPLGGRDYVNLYGSDITERKWLQEMFRQLNAELEQRVAQRTAEVRDSEARYRSLVTATSQLIWTTNALGEVVEDIPSWRAFTGQTYDEVKGWGWASALHFDDLEPTRNVWQHAVATHTLYETEYRLRRHDGEYRHFAARGVPVTEEDGGIREWVGACTDITERKAARARRDATNGLLDLFARKGSSKEYLAGVVEVIRAWADCQCLGIRVVDEHGAISYDASVGFDPEFLQVENQHSPKTNDCGCLRVITRTIEEQDRPLLTPGGSLRCDNTADFLSQLPPQQRSRYRASFASAGFASVAVIPIRYHDQILGALHLADRRPARFPPASVAFLESMAPLIGEALQRFLTRAELAKHRDHFEVLVRLRTSELENTAAQLQVEIAERRQAQEALQQAADELERSNRDLEQFAHVASHDLQEPLRAVSGFVNLLQARFPDKVDAKAAQYITGACDGAERMGRLIDGVLAFSRVNAKDRDHVPVDLNTLLADALSNLHASLNAAHAQVTHDHLPTLQVDPTQTTQLFQNLIGNAIKFRGEQPPQVHIGAREEPDHWVFSVRDHGIGIEPQYFERIFQLFQRLHTHKAYPGTGIGLALCKKIVERHGGKIWVESKLGQGTTFFFSLPRLPG